MHFMIHYPNYDENQDMTLDGNAVMFDYECMSRAVKPRMWMPNKYGQDMIPWECSIIFPNTQGNNCGQFKLDAEVQVLEYNYHIEDTSMGLKTWEREPKR